MASVFVLLGAVLVASIVLDGFVRPQRGTMRDWAGVLLHSLTIAATFGLLLAISGNAYVGAVVTLALMALFLGASNAKNAVLGEPLIFSDLALLSFVIRHPRFYFSAVSGPQRWIAAIVSIATVAILIRLSALDLAAHVTGAAMAAMALGILWLLLGHEHWVARRAPRPDLHQDVARYGLLATLLLYWQRWHDSRDPAPAEALTQTLPDAPELIVVVQCESFADPVEITQGPETALPGLTAARASASRWGQLEVSGFGAYTMRTEYAALFGRSEDELGFRRFDPFLTALGETSYALPARLSGAGYRAIFVHPYDMRFYGRDRLMPAIGFDRLVGQDEFPPLPADARYVDDPTLGDKILALSREQLGPLLIYAVTMENHGPWEAETARGSNSRLETFLRRLRSSDAMLANLIEGVRSCGRPALLAFFGDHRPTIPGVLAPGGERHTPYVLLRFDAEGRPVAGDGRVDITPAELHHAILRSVGPPASTTDRSS